VTNARPLHARAVSTKVILKISKRTQIIQQIVVLCARNTLKISRYLLYRGITRGSVAFGTAAVVPWSKRCCRQVLCFSRKPLRCTAMDTYCSAQVESVFHLHGTVKWPSVALVAQYNRNGDGWMSDQRQPTGGLNYGQVCGLVYELAATWRWPTFTKVTWVNFRIWLCRRWLHCIVLVVLYYYCYYCHSAHPYTSEQWTP